MPHPRAHLFVPLLVAACAHPRPAPPPLIPEPYAVLPAGDTVTRTASKVTVDSILATLTVRQKIGQLVFPWLLGDYASLDGEGLDTLYAAIDSLEIGGLIVSIGSPLDVAAKLNALQRRSSLPLLVAADLEYGAGMRFQGATAFPRPMAVGATGRELDAYEVGRITALEARAIGVQVTFSPVADVNNNPLNPIINTRSFGEDPRAVARLVAAYVRGAQEHGLFAVAKHFPGHGDVSVDSHITIPVAPGCWDRLDTLEMVPFRAAIAAGVTGIMTAHVALPCLTPTDTVPATLSREATEGLLRDSLGFKGFIVTDALVMGAIVERFGAGESAVRAFLAGSDLLLMPADLHAAVDAMQAAVTSGRISQARLEQSVRRILTLKLRAGLFARRTVPLDSVPGLVGRRLSQDVADDIARRSLTLVQRGPLDSLRSHRGRAAVITYAEETNLSIGNELVQRLRAAGDTVTVFRLYPASGTLSYDSARTILQNAPRAVFAPSVRPIAWRGHVDMPDSLAHLILDTSAAHPTVLVSLGSPYLLAQLPGFGGGFLIAWSTSMATERAAAEALTGTIAISGHLPITLDAAHPRGSGIQIGRLGG